MNLDLRLIRNKLFQRKKLRRNLLPHFRIAKDRIEINHRMFSPPVHRIRKVNPIVNHRMVTQVVRLHRIIRKLKAKLLHQLLPLRKKLLFLPPQFPRKLLNPLLHLLVQKLILKKSQTILNRSHLLHRRMIINNPN